MSIRFTPNGITKNDDAPAELRPGTDAGRKLHEDYCGCSGKGQCSLSKRVRAIEQEAGYDPDKQPEKDPGAIETEVKG